ncbi:hypothetical protein [Nocardia sp. CA-135398]|uniref:hypothetical protein n=1 Tax=Nocardia sp. CA-135398 TaxID=3239977 RepID=UPI003D97DA12
MPAFWHPAGFTAVMVIATRLSVAASRVTFAATAYTNRTNQEGTSTAALTA